MKKALKILHKKNTHLISNQKGFGIKEIAISLGAIVAVGIVLTVFRDQAGSIFNDVWNMIKDFIGSNIGD
ncbi:MAG: hypothetical protein GX383_11860 [Clostridium sp.]|jgi:hypothetical protein|nr:hypothetical protein [Clostridium sp.]